MAKAEVSAQGTSAPVQVNSQLTPPNSIYLSDYANASLNKWPITLTLRDFTKSDYRVRLRITIESQTVRLRTKPTFRPTGIYLNAGIPTQVPYDKLSAYLNPNNLEISGINPGTFSNSQQLPEGFYTFTVEVLDYQRGNVVSNVGRSVAWIVQNDPPLLNLPYEDKLRIQEPQQVQFQWTPRHTASPNSTFETEYIFRLWEIWPADRNPFEVVRTSNPIFEQRTNLNSYFYGPGDIALVPGRNYAWQVQAVSNIGRDLFKNDGKSVVESFQYGDECLPITGLGIEALGPDRIQAEWTGDWNHSGYVVKVRESGTTEWTNYATNIETQVLFDLETDTEYEVQVFSKCGVLTGNGSQVQAVSTFAEDVVDFNCGEEPDNPTITNREPIANLQVGDKIEALGFKVRITEISGTGPYNGKGAIEVPLFNLAGVKADLVNIEVNTDKKLIGGSVETTLNPEGPFIISLGGEDELDEGNAGEDGTEETPDTDIEIDEVITDVEVDEETGEIVVTTEDGETTTIDPDEEGVDENEDGDIVIEDSNGDTWVVGPDGNVTEGQNTGGPSNPSTLPADAPIDFIVNFEESDQQEYGFDAKSLETLSSYYTQTQIRDNNYWLAWKSVASGRTDKVLAKQSSGDSFNNAIGFKTIAGNLPITAASEDLAKNVTVQGTTHQDEQVVQAYVLKETQDDQGETTEEEIILGELNVVSYDKLSQKVVIVPVNGVSAPTASTLSNELNRIYGQAVAEWEVVMAGNYTSEMSLAGLDDEESSTFSAYSSAMNDFKREYRRNNNIDRDAYYVFLMSGTGSSKSGYMPFKRQYGFIFSDNTNDLTKTIAHELGHGAFRLRHTFSNEGYIASEGSTNNLMDYSDGTKLYKHQWDLVHDPENVNTLFEDDEEGAAGIKIKSNQVVELINLLRSSNRDSVNELNISRFKEDDYLYRGNIRIGESESFELMVEHWYYSGEHIINPLQKDAYMNPEIDDQAIIEFDGSIANGDIKPLLRLRVNESNYSELSNYIFGDDTLRVRMELTLVSENSKNTLSSFIIDSDSVSGFIIEREAGTYSEERTRGSQKRIPGNIYLFEENDCGTNRANCTNEYTIITTPEKSGTRDGVLIHTGTNYLDVTGCLIPVGSNYTSSEQQFDIGGNIQTITIYASNGTSGTTLNNINTYLNRRRNYAVNNGLILKMEIKINR